MKVLFEKHPIFHKVNEEFKRCIQIDEVRERALAREMFQHDVASRLTYARREGIAEGEEKEKVGIARAMKSKGFDDKTISEITGLTKEELAGI